VNFIHTYKYKIYTKLQRLINTAQSADICGTD